MEKERIAIIDIETTGMVTRLHEIIEVACIVADQEVENPQNIEILEEYSSRIIPEHIETASPFALKLNGYTEDGWKDALPKIEVLKKISVMTTFLVDSPYAGSDKLNYCIILGHNVVFDISMLTIEYMRHNIDHVWNKYSRDTGIMAKMLMPDKEQKDLSLKFLRDKYGLSHDGAHTALGDAKATLEVYKYLLRDIS